MKATVPARGAKSNPEHDRETMDLIFQGHPLPDQLACAMINERSA